MRRLAVAAAVVTTVIATLASAAPLSAATGSAPGVTKNAVKLGYIYSKAGLAGSTFQHAGDACQARVNRENAKGGVNGRKIDLQIVDDSGNVNNLTAAQDLVQNRNVFAVIDNSAFATGAYRFLLDQGVPMIGGGYDGNEYGQPGNENLISATGNQAPTYGLQYTSAQDVLKKFKAKNVGVVAYGISPSSTAAAKNFQQYVVKGAGLNPAYTNTAVDFGTSDVGPIILGMKNANVDAVYLPLVAATNFAILRTARENGLNFKVAMLATGYGQPLLDDPISKTLGTNILFGTGWEPVELKTPATKQFQQDLKKFNGYSGVPDFGQYTGYIDCDLAIEGLKAAGTNLTRQGFIDATKGLKDWKSAGLGCQAVDLSKQNFGKAAPTSCAWQTYVKNGKFVVYNNGKPVRGTLIRASTTATTTTSTSTPSS
jgi:branched-chain amino acid transport system substrate-binding protein